MKTADISPCGKYRYRLTRGTGRLMPVAMLNPSVADGSKNDPTVRRLMGFATRSHQLGEGPNPRRSKPYDGIDVVNLYALIATNPQELRTADDPYGPGNDKAHMDFCAQHGTSIIVAWGNHAEQEAVEKFMHIVHFWIGKENLISCFGTNKNGSPKHPLYLPYDCGIHPFHY